MLRDITEKKRANGLVNELAEKTNILNSITRHDIINQLLVVEGNVDLLRGKLTEEGQRKNLALITMASKNISHQLAFLRAYQDIGLKGPVWQDIHDIIPHMPLPLSEKGIELNIDTKNVEIFGRPAIGEGLLQPVR